MISSFEEITRSTPEKSLLAPLKKTGGRNNRGRVTANHRGGGHKRRYRIIDFIREREGVPAEVKTIEYDPNRSARIALVQYSDGEKRYIVAPAGLQVGQTVMSGHDAEPEVGNMLYLSDIPLGTVVHNIELEPGHGSVMARSAGASAVLQARDGKFATLRLPSGEVRLVLVTCRWLGIRPRTRGVAMNPVDHPMGGGEGKASGGHPRSRTGVLAKGYKTRRPKNPSNKFIVERRKRAK